MTTPVTVDDVLARSLLFGALDQAHRSALARQMRDVALRPGQMLFSRGDPGTAIFLVLEGRVRLSVLSAEGRELSFAHALPGDIFGEIAALDGAHRSADATALTHARLKALPQAALHNLLMTHSPVALAAIKLLCGRVRECSEHFEAIALHPVEVRLARLLVDRLAEGAGSAAHEATSLTLEMTQSELALLIGTTRQRANAALAVLEKARGIRRVGGRVHCNPAILKSLAQRD